MADNQLDKLNKTKSYQDNQLITAVAQMETLSQKLFEIAVGAINPTKDAESNRVVRIKKSLVESFLPKTGKLRPSQLNDVMKKLVKESVFSFETYGATGGKKTITVAPISYVEVEENGEFIKLSFTNEILPLLTDLKRDYTKLNVQEIGNLSSSNNISIYKFLMKSYNAYENYKNSGMRTQAQLKEILNPEIYVDELRRLTNTLGTYAVFRDFERRVLATAVADINNSTNLDVSYTKKRIGRKIGKIQFHIKDKTNASLNALQDTDLDPRTITARKEFAILFGSQIIPFELTQDNELLFSLVPLLDRYQQFIEQYGESTLNKHLQYVRTHMHVMPKSISNYLLKALSSYEETLKKPQSKPKISRTKRVIKDKETLPEWAQEDYRPSKISDEKIAELIAKEKRLKRKLAMLSIESKQKQGMPLSEEDLNNAKKYGIEL